MGDLFGGRLLDSLPMDSCRFRAFSLPLNLSPPIRFSNLRFSSSSSSSSPRFRSSPSVLAERSLHSTSSSNSLPSRLDIVSTTEHSDGSIVFKFGDSGDIGNAHNNDARLSSDETLDRDPEVGVFSELEKRESISSSSVSSREKNEISLDGQFESDKNVKKDSRISELVVLNTETEETSRDFVVGLSSDDHFGDYLIEKNNQTTTSKNAVENPRGFHAVGHSNQVDVLGCNSELDIIVEREESLDSGKTPAEMSDCETEITVPSSELESGNGVRDSYGIQEIGAIGPNVGGNVPPNILQGGTDGDVVSCDVAEVSGSQTVETFSTDLHREEISISKCFLSSGAASLPHPAEALTGVEGAYFVACQNWFGVADGVGQWSLEGIRAGHYAQELMQNCEKLLSSKENVLTDVKCVLKQSAAAAVSHGSATVLIAHFDHQVLHVANIGDTGYCIIRNGFAYQKSSPLFHEFNFPLQIARGDDPLEVLQEYHIDVEVGDVIVSATDGLFDNLYEQEIASIVSKSLASSMKPKEIAILLATRAQEVGRSESARSPFAASAHAAGFLGYSGGKLDAVTVIISLVQKSSTSST
ncbi:hypothetical protein Nepgr_025561 [Nepenthes gracilis]|uniref:Protein phosphatase n=1 Tax=Nepenthes gracilis TaxID=150966 RepID=A0AAD3T553_NEPGR|nr:hypothetical protein Nepgr_025561 [Nepenthes gracilis]